MARPDKGGRGTRWTRVVLAPVLRPSSSYQIHGSNGAPIADNGVAGVGPRTPSLEAAFGDRSVFSGWVVARLFTKKKPDVVERLPPIGVARMTQ